VGEKVLKVTNLKKYYPTVKAVDGIDFWVNKGTAFTLLGPNGAGKTTTLEIIEGIKNADEGEIEFFGKKMKHVDSATKERIGVSLQETNFLPHLKVKEIISLFGSFFKKSLPVDTIIDFVSLKEKENDFVEKLSGGQKQRVAIACALINDPDIILADEPTGNLDPETSVGIMNLLFDIRSSGRAVIMATHDYSLFREFKARTLKCEDGKLIELENQVD